MSKKSSKYFISVPRELIRSDQLINNRAGVLMAYCLLQRMGTVDGIYYGDLRMLLNNLQLTYYPEKKKALPKQFQLLIAGIDYLCNSGYYLLDEGDYHYIDNYFTLHFDSNALLNKQFVLLNYMDFDYILDLNSRHNKSVILYTLLWVKTNYILRAVNGKTFHYTASCYPSIKMGKLMDITPKSIETYLKILSNRYGTNGTRPLCCFKKFGLILPNDKIINFANIYVENTTEAATVYHWKREEFKKRFHARVMDYDEVWGDVVEDDNLDEDDIQKLFDDLILE